MTSTTPPTDPESQPAPTSGVSAHAGGDLTVGGDVVGRDKVVIYPPADRDQQIKFATRADYLAQLIDRHRDLEFVGIPELKDRQALRIEDVFIHLQAEAEPGLPEPEELKEDYREADVPLPPRSSVRRRLTLNEAVRENLRLVILGDPGAGKTTLLKYILLAFAQDSSDRIGLAETRLPIFLRLYDFVTKRPTKSGRGYSLVDYVYAQARESLQVALPPGFFEAELERGGCCLCLDGLDELGEANLRREVTQQVAALANRYPRNRYIVTARIVGYNDAPLDSQAFTHHVILPLSEGDIRLFVEKWYTAREKDVAVRRERAAHLTRALTSEPRLKSLAANPLLLTIIALVHRIEAELPNERVKLYDKCVTALIETWENVKGLATTDRERPHYKYLRRLLEQLAFWMHTQPGLTGTAREVGHGDLLLQLTEFLQFDPGIQLDRWQARQEAQAFIQLARGRTGLLVERGESIYAFSHLSFQEYLTAAHIEYEHAHSIDEIWSILHPRLADPHWREVILLLLGGLNNFRKHPTEIVRRILQRQDAYEPILHRHLYLAARAFADRVRVDTRLHQQAVDHLVAVARTDWLARDDAFAALTHLKGDDYAAGALLALALDLNAGAEAQRGAAQALGHIGRSDDAIVNGLHNLARDSRVDADVRRDAAQALGWLGRGSEAAQVLLTLARDDAVHDWARSTAVQVMGQLSYPDTAVISGLMSLARDTYSPTLVRRDAAHVLGQMGWAGETAQVLLALIFDDTLDEWVRRAAVQALGYLGPSGPAVPHSLLAVAHDAAVPSLVRRVAAQALGQLGPIDETLLANVQALAHDHMDAWVRSAAAQALGQLGHAELTARILLDIILDPDTEELVKSESAQALGQLGAADIGPAEQVVVTGLLSVAKDEAADVLLRRDTAQALGQLGRANEATLAALLKLADDPETPVLVQRAAAQALGQLGQATPSVIAGLLALAAQDERDGWVRHAAAQSLGQLGQATDDVLAGLLALALDQDADDWARSAAVLALGQLGRAEVNVLAGLMLLACDRRASALVRRDSTQALSQLGYEDDAILSGLFALAGDRAVPSLVRRAAVQTLGQLGQAKDSVISGLLSLARDKQVDHWVRSAAVRTLGQLGQSSEPVLSSLLALVGDASSKAVQRVAYNSLKSLLGRVVG